MTLSLENSFLHWSFTPGQSGWTLTSNQAQGSSWQGNNLPAIALQGVESAVFYRRGRAALRTSPDWQPADSGQAAELASPHGPLRQVSLHTTGPEGLHCELTFALPAAAPFCRLQMRLTNQGAQPLQIDRLELLNAAPSFGGAAPAAPAFFSNGWQSWSYAGVYHPKDRYRTTRLGPFRVPTDANPGTPRPRQTGQFASDMFAVLADRASRAGLLAGFLAQRQHFGSLAAQLGPGWNSLRMWANGDGARLDPGAHLASDWACLHFLNLDSPDPLGPYVEAAAREHGLPPDILSGPVPIPVGWCSWYQFSSSGYIGTVTAPDIQHNLEAVASLRPDLPLQIVQIDDGFETQVGDWFSFTPGFPQGVAPLAAGIQATGLTPGLWLAPFIVHPASRLAAAHPEWLVRGRLGRPANAGFLWNNFTAGLDMTHPGAREFVHELIATAVHHWGFPYLKLDFLYAAALPGQRHDPTQTRAQALRTGLEVIRQAAGDQATLLGCGCPLGSAIGLVDAMRIGADTARHWMPQFGRLDPYIKLEPNLPSARNAGHNTLTRAALHRRWWINDPDCLLLDGGAGLTLAEIQTLASLIALSGGSLLLSDHLPDLPPVSLDLARSLLPLIGRRPQVCDLFDATHPARLRLDLESPAGPWHLLARLNWTDEPQDLALHLPDFGLPLPGLGEAVWVREFWSGKTDRLAAGPLPLPGVAPHGVRLLALRRGAPDSAHYLGSDLHISQGLEVAHWRWRAGTLSLGLQRPGQACGQIELSLPNKPAEAWLDGTSIPWADCGDGRYRFTVTFERQTELRLRVISIIP